MLAMHIYYAIRSNIAIGCRHEVAEPPIGLAIVANQAQVGRGQIVVAGWPYPLD
jgi:hypothetical protein